MTEPQKETTPPPTSQLKSPVPASIGRIVHYHAAGSAAPVAAIIVQVHSDSCVSLTTFPWNGAPTPQSSVQFGDPSVYESEEPDKLNAADQMARRRACWCWPPKK